MPFRLRCKNGRYHYAMKRRTIVVGGVGLASLGVVGWLAWKESSRKAPQANLEATRQRRDPDPAAFFGASFADMNDAMVPMRSLQGQPLVINFWATWCPPCVKEMPSLDQIAADMPQARVVGVAIDNKTNVTAFLEKIPVRFAVYVAGHAGIEITRALGNEVMGLPFTVLINPQGQIFSVIKGEVDPAALRVDIARMLAG